MQPLRPRPIVLFEQKRRGKVARNLFHVDLRYPHPLITVPGFEVSQVRGCTMRIVNLGILQNFNGSVVSLLVSHGLLENNSNICVVVFDVGEPDRVSFSVRFSIPPYAFLQDSLVVVQPMITSVFCLRVSGNGPGCINTSSQN